MDRIFRAELVKEWVGISQFAAAKQIIFVGCARAILRHVFWSQPLRSQKEGLLARSTVLYHIESVSDKSDTGLYSLPQYGKLQARINAEQ